MDLLVIFKLLVRRIVYLIGIPLLAVVLAYILTAGDKKSYRSTAQLSTGYTITEEVNVTTKRFNPYESGVQFSNLIETMESSRVISLLSYKLLLHDIKSDEKDSFRKIDLSNEDTKAKMASLDMPKIEALLESKLDSMIMLNTHIEEERHVQEILELYGYDQKSLKETFDVARVKSTDYVSSTAFTENPYLSAYIVNTLCSEFMRFNSSIIDARKHDLVTTFAKLVQEKRKELDRVSYELQVFKTSNNMANFMIDREGKIGQIAELETEYQDEVKNNRRVSYQFDDIKNRIDNFSGNSETATNVDVLEVRKKINSLNQRYQASGSTNRVLSDSLTLLRAQQQRLIRIVSQENTGNSYEELLLKKNDLEVELQISNKNVEALQSRIRSASSEVGGYVSKEARIDALEREISLANEDYRATQEKYNQALNVAFASGNSIQQIQLGLPALDPEPSKRTIIAGLAGVSVFSLLVLIIVLLEYIDVSIKSPFNFSKSIDIKLIGMLNHLNLKKGDVFSLFEENQKKNENRNVYREHLRKLRFQMTQSGKKVILFTSTKMGAGKSSVIQSLALSMSQSRLKVLIIDTNFSNNTLSKTFEAPGGLEDVVSSENEVKPPIKKTTLPGVDIIGCTGGEYSASEKINSKSMIELITKMKKYYHFIFLEGAALNKYSDSGELSIFVDGIVTVFSAKSSLKQLDNDSVEFVKSFPNKNLGAILNDVELREMG